MKKASAADRTNVIDIICRSFDQNRSVNSVVKQDYKRSKRIKALVAYSFDVCMIFGEVWISDDERAAALILLSDQKKTTIKSILLDLKLAFKAIGVTRIFKVLNREKCIKENYSDQSYIYIWFIGVDPDYQHKGKGSRLLKQVIYFYKSLDQVYYLETSVDRNLSWYASFGFEVYHQIKMGYDLYLLKK